MISLCLELVVPVLLLLVVIILSLAPLPLILNVLRVDLVNIWLMPRMICAQPVRLKPVVEQVTTPRLASTSTNFIVTLVMLAFMRTLVFVMPVQTFAQTELPPQTPVQVRENKDVPLVIQMPLQLEQPILWALLVLYVPMFVHVAFLPLFVPQPENNAALLVELVPTEIQLLHLMP